MLPGTRLWAGTNTKYLHCTPIFCYILGELNETLIELLYNLKPVWSFAIINASAKQFFVPTIIINALQVILRSLPCHKMMPRSSKTGMTCSDRTGPSNTRFNDPAGMIFSRFLDHFGTTHTLSMAENNINSISYLNLHLLKICEDWV